MGDSAPWLTALDIINLLTDLLLKVHNKLILLLVPKKPPSILVQDEPIQQDQDNVSMGPFFIEAMLTADKTTCDFYGNETLDYLLDTANLVI